MEKNAVIFSKDIVSDLEKILAVNTDSYRSDFYRYDESKLICSSRQNCKGGRTANYLWLTCRYGTYLVREYDAFIEGTEQNINWCSYKGSAYERPLAFAVQVYGNDNGKVVGAIHFIDYEKMSKQSGVKAKIR